MPLRSAFTLTAIPLTGTGAETRLPSVADMNANVVLAGASMVLFSGDAGTYTLIIDGRSDKQTAYYDLKISVVPLPAGMLLLLTGIGVLVYVG